MTTFNQFLVEEPSPVELIMTKMLKGSSGVFTPKNLELVFKELKGWKIEKGVHVMQTTRISNEEKDRLGLRNNPDVYQFTSKNDDLEFNAKDLKNLEIIHELIGEKTVKTVPTSPKAETYFYTNLGKIKEGKDYWTKEQRYTFSVKCFYASKGFNITGPKGLKFEAKKEPGYLRPDFYGFMKWIKEDGKQFTSDLQALVGDPTAKKKKPINPGVTDECQICEGIQKLNKGKMVLHGYKRPGIGWTVGRCPGAGHVPYSESCAECKKYKAMLEEQKTHFEKKVRQLKSKNVTSISYYDEKKKEHITIKPSDKEWDSKLKTAIWQNESQVKAVISELDRMTKRIKNWKKVS